MIHLKTPVGRVAIDETKIVAVNEENHIESISCKVWVGESLTDDSGFNILNDYDEVISLIATAKQTLTPEIK